MGFFLLLEVVVMVDHGSSVKTSAERVDARDLLYISGVSPQPEIT
jgi:hypothetical protein